MSLLTLKTIRKHIQINEHNSLTKDTEAMPFAKLTAKPQTNHFILPTLISSSCIDYKLTVPRTMLVSGNIKMSKTDALTLRGSLSRGESRSV